MISYRSDQKVKDLTCGKKPFPGVFKKLCNQAVKLYPGLPGFLYREMTLKEGVPTGKIKEFYSPGNLRRVYTYKNGKPTGESLEFWKNKNLKSQSIYGDRGQLVKYILFFKDGKTRHKFLEMHPTEDRILLEKLYYQNGKVRDERNWHSKKIFLKKLYNTSSDLSYKGEFFVKNCSKGHIFRHICYTKKAGKALETS